MALDLPEWLADRLTRTYADGNWSGKGVRPALEGVTLEEAHWRPTPDQHTIAEMAAHMAFWCWKAASWFDPESATDPGEEEWPAVLPSVQAWAQVVDELARAHAACAAIVRRLDPAVLEEHYRPAGPGPWNKLSIIVDLATHDSYHVAQIFVLRRLYAAAHPVSP